MSARRDAVFALALWQAQGTFPTAALGDGPDHAFALDLVGTALRHRSELEWLVGQCVRRMPQGEPWAALLIGAVQLIFMPKVAAYAAVAETVQAVKPAGKGAAALVNAVLRRILRERDALMAGLAAQPVWVRLNLPKGLWQRWKRDFGDARATAMAEATALTPSVCVRPLPPYGAPAGCEPHPDDPTGTFMVPHGTRVEALEGYAEGRFAVQDPATRHAVELMEVRPGLRVLDACAAPGGKTVQLAARLAGQGTVVACEKIPARLDKLAATVRRCGLEDCVELRQADLTEPFEGVYDRVLIDAPCSNTGVFGRRPDARWTWSARKTAALVETQRALLDRCAEHVAPGGILVYSTCSVDPEENQAQAAAFLGRHPEFACGEERTEFPAPGHDGAYAAAFVRRPAER